MSGVIRRPKIERRSAAPLTRKVLVLKYTPAEERERLVRLTREQRLHAEVLGEFARLGVVDSGDPMKSARGQYRAGERGES